MLPLRIACRYLFARKSHNAVNVISMVSLAGVAVATAAMVCVLSVFNGFSRLAEQRLSTVDSDFRIERVDRRAVTGGDSLAAVLSQIDGVAAAEPVVTTRGLALYGDRQVAVELTGVTGRWREAVGFDYIVVDGGEEGVAMRDAGVTIGAGVAVKLGAHPDYYPRFRVYVPRRRGRANPANPLTAFRGDSLAVAEVFRSDHAETDASVVVMPLWRLRAMLEYDDGEATAVDVIADGTVSDSRLDALLSEAVGDGMRVVARADRDESSSRMIAIEKWISFVMLAFIMLIASFNVVSTLSMLIIEKRSSMSILRSMGATRRSVAAVFVWQGLLISACGGALGMILGSALTLAQQWGGFIHLAGDPAQLSVTVYPVRLEAVDLVAVFAVVVAVGALVAFASGLMARRPLNS